MTAACCSENGGGYILAGLGQHECKKAEQCDA
jgi:hypothetical protein